MAQAFVGFPPPLLGDQPQRLKVLYDAEDFLCLEKPQGTLIDAHPWHSTAPSIIAALHQQNQAGKLELQPYKIERPYEVYPLEPEASGIALIAKNKAAATKLKNQHGSGEIEFTFQLLCRNSPLSEKQPDTFSCQLPIASHNKKPLALISSTTGKKTTTHFKRLKAIGPFTLWEARTTHLRLHQIRLHAAESGLRIAGDPLYARSKAVLLHETLSRKKNLKPIDTKARSHTGCWLHLHQIKLPNHTTITLQLRDKLAATLKKLERKYDMI